MSEARTSEMVVPAAALVCMCNYGGVDWEDPPTASACRLAQHTALTPTQHPPLSFSEALH